MSRFTIYRPQWEETEARCWCVPGAPCEMLSVYTHDGRAPPAGVPGAPWASRRPLRRSWCVRGRFTKCWQFIHKMARRPLWASPAPPGRPLSHFTIYCPQWEETVAGVPGVPSGDPRAFPGRLAKCCQFTHKMAGRPLPRFGAIYYYTDSKKGTPGRQRILA